MGRSLNFDVGILEETSQLENMLLLLLVVIIIIIIIVRLLCNDYLHAIGNTCSSYGL